MGGVSFFLFLVSNVPPFNVYSPRCDPKKWAGEPFNRHAPLRSTRHILGLKAQGGGYDMNPYLNEQLALSETRAFPFYGGGFGWGFPGYGWGFPGYGWGFRPWGFGFRPWGWGWGHPWI